MHNRDLMVRAKCCRDDRVYDKAYELFSEAALSNNPIAIKNIGIMYLYGEGVEEKYEKAFRYFKRSYDISKDIHLIRHVMVAHEDIVASDKGGSLYRDFIEYLLKQQEWELLILKAEELAKGVIYPKDIFGMLSCYEEAIKHGVLLGAECLGEIYFLGEYVETDYEMAYKYFSSFSGNMSFAKPYYLGRMYEEGLFLKKDVNKALDEYKKITCSSIPMKSCDTFYLKAEKRVRSLCGGVR